ncbi:hypothetical protein [Gemella sanguinis]
MELFLPYIIMYLLFSILLMYIFQIIGKNSILAFIPLYSMYIALKFFKGRIYYRNWGMFYVIGTILVIPVIYIIVGIITEYHKSQSVQYSSNPWAGFGEFMTGIFFMFFFINLILIIGNMLVYLPIIKDRLWVCVLFVVWNIYYLFKFVIYMIIEPGNFLVFYIIYIINILMNLFFIFYIANVYKKLQLENKTIVSEIDYDKYPRSEIKRMIRSRNYNLFEK